MISVDGARARILADFRPTPAEIVALAEAWNRVTAAPVVARLTQPPADVSAMDGYALRATDGTLHATLRVIGAAPAGHPFGGSVGPGQAVRLFTGSVVPAGAEAITTACPGSARPGGGCARSSGECRGSGAPGSAVGS